MTAEGKALKEAYQWEAKSQWQGPPFAGDVEVSVRFYFKTKARNLDNQNKLILDALTGIAYEDEWIASYMTVTLRRDEPAYRDRLRGIVRIN